MSDNITPKYKIIPFKEKVFLPENTGFASTIGNGLLQKIVSDSLTKEGNFVNDVINNLIDTSSKTILGEFVFTESGAIQIGTYEEGVTGDIRISPLGIVARGLDGNNTITIDGTTGSVTLAGSINATSGYIAGWSILTSSIYFDGDTDETSSGMSRLDYPFYAGKKYADRATAPFRVTPAGAVTASNITITGGLIGGIGVEYITNLGTTEATIVPEDLSIFATGITTATDGTQSAYTTLTWTEVTTDTFDHYIVKYKKHSYTYYQYITIDTNTITIDGLVPNTSYDYAIASVNKYGTVSSYSDLVNGTTATDETPPSTVTANSATGGIQYVILEWTHNTETDLASYNIYRNTEDNSAEAELIGNVRTNYFVDGNRTGDTTYYYWIKAVDTSGNVSESFSAVKSATPRNVSNDDIVTLAGSKVLIDGEVYLSNWRKTGDLTKIDGGSISANTITTTQLNFTPIQSTNIVASINASEEGIQISGDYIAINGSTSFASGYDPTSKVGAVGGSYASASSGARVLIFPDANTGLQIIDNAANDVFKAMVGGTDVGDITIGDFANNKGLKWDKSAAAFYVRGALVAGSGSTIAADYFTSGTITSKTITLDFTEGAGDCYIACGKTDFDHDETGFIFGIDDSDSNKAKLLIGNSTKYLNWDGNDLSTTNLSILNMFTSGEQILANEVCFIIPENRTLIRAYKQNDGGQFDFGTPVDIFTHRYPKWSSRYLTGANQIEIKYLSLYLSKHSSSGYPLPTDSVRISLQTDNNGVPSGTVIGEFVFEKAAADIAETLTEYNFAVTTPSVIAANTYFWIVVERTGDINKYSAYSSATGNLAAKSLGISGGVQGSKYWDGDSWEIPSNLNVASRQIAMSLSFNAIAGYAYRASAYDTDNHDSMVFIAYENVAKFVDFRLNFSKVVSGFTGLTLGSEYYLANEPGTIATSAGNVEKKIGKAFSTTGLIIY
ncbi:MAG: hypothetical protein PHS54_01580 [Clostridia bacterium]|nr:hypothetical protein [Clostridia bacterium]